MPLAAQLDKEHRFPAEQVGARVGKARLGALFLVPWGRNTRTEAECISYSGLAENLSLEQLVALNVDVVIPTGHFELFTFICVSLYLTLVPLSF